jgi:prepilin signal peptidase PulO-like enzyme (type II secretory pathway)
MGLSIATASIGAIIFAAAAACGIVAANAILPKLHRFDDAPPTVDFPPSALVAGAAVVGAAMGLRTPPLVLLVISAIVVVGLVAAWYCDAKTGILPDVFTLIPLALVLIVGLAQQQWMVLVSAAVLFIPFALLAFLSKGRGMGWGDAKLAALGGALLGVSTATLAFVLASFVAALAAWLKYRKRNAPIAMGPYLVAAIAASLPFTF